MSPLQGRRAEGWVRKKHRWDDQVGYRRSIAYPSLRAPPPHTSHLCKYRTCMAAGLVSSTEVVRPGRECHHCYTSALPSHICVNAGHIPARLRDLPGVPRLIPPGREYRC